MATQRFEQSFLEGVVPGTHEETYVNGVKSLESLAFQQLRGRGILAKYSELAWQDLFAQTKRTQDIATPKTEAQWSALWEERMRNEGPEGAFLLDTMASLGSAIEGMRGRKIDFMLPTKRHIEPRLETGFIVGPHMSLVSTFFGSPDTCVNIGAEPAAQNGIYVGVLHMLNVSIAPSVVR